MISTCEKVRFEQLRKAKYSILASISHICQKKFLQSLTHTCTIHCVNLMIFLYLALNLETFLKNAIFWKNSFCQFFLNKTFFINKIST